jgi:hypothetical protein
MYVEMESGMSKKLTAEGLRAVSRANNRSKGISSAQSTGMRSGVATTARITSDFTTIADMRIVSGEYNLLNGTKNKTSNAAPLVKNLSGVCTHDCPNRKY